MKMQFNLWEGLYLRVGYRFEDTHPLNLGDFIPVTGSVFSELS